MTSPISYVLEIPAATPTETFNFMQAKLAYYTDAADVAEDLRNGVTDIIVIDTRTEQAYEEAHIPGAINFRPSLMTPESVQRLDPNKTYVSYCDGIGCNGSTKGAHKLASLGFKVKELLGGLDFWRRDGNPVATGPEVGSLAGSEQIACNC